MQLIGFESPVGYQQTNKSIILARVERFELSTVGFGSRRSANWSYTLTFLKQPLIWFRLCLTRVQVLKFCFSELLLAAHNSNLWDKGHLVNPKLQLFLFTFNDLNDLWASKNLFKSLKFKDKKTPDCRWTFGGLKEAVLTTHILHTESPRGTLAGWEFN